MEASSKFDNNVTARYKAAGKLGLPVRYTYVTADGSVASLVALITQRINE